MRIVTNGDKEGQRKKADAELHFSGGILDGLKLIGFGAPRRR